MKSSSSRKAKRKAYHVATCGRERVSVYKRIAPNGSACFMVANYSEGKRRFDSHATPELAIEAAGKLARQMSERQVLAASLTNAQASEYAAVVQKLAPFNITPLTAADALAEILKEAGDLAFVRVSVLAHKARSKRTTAKSVETVVTELLAVKAARGASARYIEDLRSRLNRFKKDFQKDVGDVTTADIQAWLDNQKKLSPQSHVNFRRVLHLFFKFAIARGYAVDNPVEGCERVKVRGGSVAIFTPAEINRLLAAAPEQFLPCLAIGAFAGLRSAEIERLSWSDVDLASRHIVIGADAAKTASRRIVPICDALADWLSDYKQRTGKVWKGTHEDFYDAQQATAAATAVAADAEQGIAALEAVKWKKNALRHSYASYRFAQIGDAGRVAGELGNSAAVVHRHYRELVKSADAEKWFAVRPERPANVTSLASATR